MLFLRHRPIDTCSLQAFLPSSCLERKVQKLLCQEPFEFNLGDGRLVTKSRPRESCIDFDKGNDESEDADFPVLGDHRLFQRNRQMSKIVVVINLISIFEMIMEGFRVFEGLCDLHSISVINRWVTPLSISIVAPYVDIRFIV